VALRVFERRCSCSSLRTSVVKSQGCFWRRFTVDVGLFLPASLSISTALRSFYLDLRLVRSFATNWKITLLVRNVIARLFLGPIHCRRFLIRMSTSSIPC